jgi:hypothetical protein
LMRPHMTGRRPREAGGNRKRSALYRALLPILGGMLIGILSTFFLKFVGQGFSF